jgi:hypothetical protein
MTLIIKYFPIKANKISTSRTNFILSIIAKQREKWTSELSMVIAQMASEMYSGDI